MFERHEDTPSEPSGWFATTQWSVVLRANGADSSQAEEALASLCQSYWYPLYAYVRHRGYDHHDAQDLTQEFFARLLEKNFLKAVRRERGKFRWFLLSALKRFLANEWNQQHALKRGGAYTVVSMHEPSAQDRYSLEGVDHTTPETFFDRAWAAILLEQAQDQLRREYESSGRGAVFDQLKIFLSGDRAPISQYEAGVPLGMQEGAVKVAVHRLRGRFQDCLRAQIAQTVSTPAEIDEEIRQLFAVLRA